MTGNATFKNGLSLSQKNKWLQVFYEPWGVLKLFIFTRLAKIIGAPIKWQAKLFWGGKVYGYFPDATFNTLYLYHFMEATLTEVVLKYLKPGMVFVDIGAYVGYYSLLASRLVGEKGRVIAFEPTADTYGLLMQNTKGINNILAEHLAVWSNDKILQFLDYGNFYASCNSYTNARMSDDILRELRPKNVKIRAISLDSYFQTLIIRPNFVKIDAESAEYEILLGMEKILANVKPGVSLEIGDRGTEKGKTLKCIRYLEKYGYEAFEYKEGKLRKHKERKEYFGVYDNLFFLPK